MLCLLPLYLQAGPRGQPKEPIVFENPQIEKDYLELSEELRCLVCQNQNLIDSNAELADDLRREVAKMLKQGNNKEQVTEFMVERYGDFVLYNPPFKVQTWLLWGGPFVLMFWGIFALLQKVKASKEENSADSSALSEQEKAKLQAILKNK
ncbi:MAG: cytochrome c-type biogenesis protein CcmH [gamma proteobacterium symbiont of Bathyaustriella thionipta]|nr:cytochrome c-type biogenesis protein CcmH [gamma proteobacterium symbiont of Bathyaustriella thionipta]MCU7956812.1 cytochrome c-type biogenesis protein CcmH [gamma proteobacterium symbiont of Bathyaustriella thionipta]MCU7968652.1 cytochrome c-type biogenesis protein CcmH [gamma proteobacterium symbiont of Bathyaustriella thionipta]